MLESADRRLARSSGGRLRGWVFRSCFLRREEDEVSVFCLPKERELRGFVGGCSLGTGAGADDAGEAGLVDFLGDSLSLFTAAADGGGAEAGLMGEIGSEA